MRSNLLMRPLHRDSRFSGIAQGLKKGSSSENGQLAEIRTKQWPELNEAKCPSCLGTIYKVFKGLENWNVKTV